MRTPCSCCGQWYLLQTPQSAGFAHNGRLIASARDNVSLHSRSLSLYFRVPPGGMTAVRSFASVTVRAGYLHTFPQSSNKILKATRSNNEQVPATLFSRQAQNLSGILKCAARCCHFPDENLSVIHNTAVVFRKPFCRVLPIRVTDGFQPSRSGWPQFAFRG